jgi:hypothetical protein
VVALNLGLCCGTYTYRIRASAMEPHGSDVAASRLVAFPPVTLAERLSRRIIINVSRKWTTNNELDAPNGVSLHSPASRVARSPLALPASSCAFCHLNCRGHWRSLFNRRRSLFNRSVAYFASVSSSGSLFSSRAIENTYIKPYSARLTASTASI